MKFIKIFPEMNNIRAAGYDLAVPLYERYCEALSSSLGKEVGRGVFGADMQVSLINDGPSPSSSTPD